MRAWRTLTRLGPLFRPRPGFLPLLRAGSSIAPGDCLTLWSGWGIRGLHLELPRAGSSAHDPKTPAHYRHGLHLPAVSHVRRWGSLTRCRGTLTRLCGPLTRLGGSLTRFGVLSYAIRGDPLRVARALLRALRWPLTRCGGSLVPAWRTLTRPGPLLRTRAPPLFGAPEAP